jgi:glutathione peroxidase
VYRRLTAAPDATGAAGDVQWNFEKFLIDGNGDVIARFRPTIQPDSPEVRTALEAVLGS